MRVTLHNLLFLLLGLAASATVSLQAAAQDCTGPNGAHGVISYNEDFGVFQGCSPQGWVSITPIVCPNGDECNDCHPINSPTPGTICADGTLFAGESPDENMLMYTTPADAGLMAWNDSNSSGLTSFAGNCTTISPGTNASCFRGRNNTNILVLNDSNSGVAGIQPHRAARYCYCLGKPLEGVCAGDPTSGAEAHGHSDWYLPAQDELNVLYVNLARDGVADVTPGNSFGFNRTGSEPAGIYWSSSQQDAGSARRQIFSTGSQGGREKRFNLAFRCVRR